MSDMNPYQQPQSDVANAAPASANEFTTSHRKLLGGKGAAGSQLPIAGI